jgi:hypothetical protein
MFFHGLETAQLRFCYPEQVSTAQSGICLCEYLTERYVVQ